jgi:hypothetical protein
MNGRTESRVQHDCCHKQHSHADANQRWALWLIFPFGVLGVVVAKHNGFLCCQLRIRRGFPDPVRTSPEKLPLGAGSSMPCRGEARSFANVLN